MGDVVEDFVPDLVEKVVVRSSWDSKGSRRENGDRENGSDLFFNSFLFPVTETGRKICSNFSRNSQPTFHFWQSIRTDSENKCDYVTCSEPRKNQQKFTNKIFLFKFYNKIIIFTFLHLHNAY